MYDVIKRLQAWGRATTLVLDVLAMPQIYEWTSEDVVKEAKRDLYNAIDSMNKLSAEIRLKVEEE